MSEVKIDKKVRRIISKAVRNKYPQNLSVVETEERVYAELSLQVNKLIQKRLNNVSEQNREMRRIINEVNVKMEQDNFNRKFDGIWRDDDAVILKDIKKILKKF